MPTSAQLGRTYCTVIAGMILLSMISGCGSQPYGTVPISGKVTYEDGSLVPAPAIYLYFESQEENVDAKTFPRRGSAKVNVADGTFSEVTTYEPGDGAIPGKHKVVVEVLGDGGVPDYSYFPREYSDAATTPLNIEVGSKRSFDLTVPKP